ncbi:MAG: hypothetical protein AABY83_07175 [Pseudomonadota bacterium]
MSTVLESPQISSIEMDYTATSARLPEDLIQHYLSNLAFCDGPQDLVNKLHEMIEPISIEYLEANRESLYILGTIWTNAVYRNIFMRDGTYFPLELLVIPPLFNSLGWQYDYDDGWRALRNVFNVSGIDKNSPQEEVVQSLIMGTFIDAIFSSPENALAKAADDFRDLSDRDDYTVILLKTGTLFGQYGWFFPSG